MANQHLEGSTVTSTKPIAVTLGDDNVNASAYGTCSDNCGDQTVPVAIIGTEYVAVPATLNAPYDKVFMTATENNTTVTVGGVFQATINAGQTHMVTLTNNQPAYIVTSKPAYCYMFTGFGCEFGTAILPKINCTGSREVSVLNSGLGASLITLVIKAGYEGNFTINGNAGLAPASAFTSVPGTNNAWKFAKITSTNFGSLVNVKNSGSEFHMGFIQGGPGTGCSVGYFSDFGVLNAPITASDTVLCTGNSLTLNTAPIVGATYNWTGPNITNTNGATLNVNSVTINNTGWYYLNTTTTSCTAKDSIYIKINASINQTVNYSSCNGQPYLGYTTSGTYIDIFPLPSGCDSIRTLNLIIGTPVANTINSTVCEGTIVYGYTTTGTYVNTFTGSNGCDSVRTLNLVVKPKKTTTINQQICQGQSYLGYTTTGTYINTFTASNGCDSVRTLNLTVVSTLQVSVYKTICLGQSYLGYTSQGTYINNFTSTFGCDSIRTLFLTVKAPQFINENKQICEGQSYFGFTTSGTYTLNLLTAEGCDSTHTIVLTVKPKIYKTINHATCDGTPYLGYTVAGTYVNTFVSSTGCDSIRTLNLTIKPKSYKTINNSICEGTSFMGFSTTGIHTINLVAANGCDSVLTINLTVKPIIRTTILKTICEGKVFEGYTTAGSYNNTFVSTITNCDSIRTLILSVTTKPQFSLGNTLELCTGDSLILNPDNFLSYIWQDGSTGRTFKIKNAGNYSVTVSNNCGSTTKNVVVTEQPCTVYFPNAFTPNNDGKNDFFKALNTAGITEFELYIYNRWGEIIFYTNDKNKGWDGTYKANIQPTGVYIFQCRATNTNKKFYFKNTILLLR